MFYSKRNLDSVYGSESLQSKPNLERKCPNFSYLGFLPDPHWYFKLNRSRLWEISGRQNALGYVFSVQLKLVCRCVKEKCKPYTL